MCVHNTMRQLNSSKSSLIFQCLNNHNDLPKRSATFHSQLWQYFCLGMQWMNTRILVEETL